LQRTRTAGHIKANGCRIGVRNATSKTNGGTFAGPITVSGAFTSPGIDDNADANAITIDSSENVGIGATNPNRGSHDRALLVSNTGSGARSAIEIEGNSSNANGTVTFLNNGTSAASIDNRGSGTLTFNTGSSLTERLRIQAGGGISFNGDTAAANALDDYETGTWTPSIGGSATYNSGNDGRYVKVGGIVHCTFLANINSRGTGSQVRLSGLPFASQNTGFVHSGCVSYFANLNSNVTFVGFYVESNATTMQFVSATGSAGPTIAGNGFSVFKDSSVVYGAVSYPTDA